METKENEDSFFMTALAYSVRVGVVTLVLSSAVEMTRQKMTTEKELPR